MGSRDRSPAWEQRIPPQELAAFDKRLSREPTDIEHIDWLTSGFSGSPVALILVRKKNEPPAQAVLKFCKSGEEEASGIESAFSNAPQKFREAHLVKPDRIFRLRDWAAVLLEIAGGDLSSYKSIAKLTNKTELAEICKAVVSSLLADWNYGDTSSTKDMTVAKFIEEIIGTSRIKGKGLIDFIDESQINRDERWFTRKGPAESLPNPLALTSRAADKKIKAFIGFGHGDLSVHNVLIQTEPELSSERFLLIDYGTFGYEYPLARDPMYLLVSLARQWLRDIKLPSESGSALAREVAYAGPPNPDLGLGEYRTVIRTIFETGRKWASTQGQGEHWRSQSFLALTGSALTFIGRDTPGLETAAVNDWLFDLAAAVEAEHLKDFRPADEVKWSVAGGSEHFAVQLIRPLRTNQASLIVASTVNSSQVDADQSLDWSLEDADIGVDQPNQDLALMESRVEQLREELKAAGPPPEPPPHTDGIGRWMVNLGYWADRIDSVISDIESFTDSNRKSPSSRFPRAAADANSAIANLIGRLSAGAATKREAIEFANLADRIWRKAGDLLTFSMEACDMGHAFLAADNQTIVNASPITYHAPSGIPEDPGLGNLMVTLDRVRSEVGLVVEEFFHRRPSGTETVLLVDQLANLHKQIDRNYLPKTEGGQRVNLVRLRKAASLAAIAFSHLIDSPSSDEQLSGIQENISELLRILDDNLPPIDL